MHHAPRLEDCFLTRRDFLQRCGIGFGALGLATLVMPGWLWGAALAGGIFYGLAGINHALQKHRNALENTAMASDLFAAIVLLGCFGWALVGGAA